MDETFLKKVKIGRNFSVQDASNPRWPTQGPEHGRPHLPTTLSDAELTRLHWDRPQDCEAVNEAVSFVGTWPYSGRT
jgi:hypothetical protein